MENQKIVKRDYGFLKDSQKNTHTIKATNTKSLLSEGLCWSNQVMLR